jgi:hypothetical protein
MRCRAVQAWMLGDETPQRPPREVRRHLQRCARCRQRYGRLVRILHEVRLLPSPAADCPAKARLLAALVATPPPTSSPASAPPLPRMMPPRQPVPVRAVQWRRWVAAAVLLLAIGLGLLALARKGPTPIEPIATAPAPSTSPSRGALEERVLEQHLRLAEDPAPGEELKALNGMATDLRGEALRQARRGAADDLALLGWLYRRVVVDGVLVSAAQVGPKDRRLEAVSGELQRTVTDVQDLLSRVSPSLAVPLGLMARTAREAVRVLGTDPSRARLTRPEAEPPVALASRQLLCVLVSQSLLVSTEDDPVRRAEHVTRVADTLAHEILERAPTADTEEAARLGQSLEAVVDRAVGGNLEQVDPGELNEGQRKQAAQVRDRAGAALATVKQNLARMPEPARRGLERAFENPHKKGPQKHGKGKGHQKEKARGPHGTGKKPKEERKHRPPGLQRP